MWQDGLDLKEKKTSVSSKDCTPCDLQQQEPSNAMLYYSDAAWQSVSGAGGMGWYCTNQTGTTIFEGTTTHEVVGSVLIAEALAFKAALEAAVSQGTQEMICLSDSKFLISQIIGNTFVNELQEILHDIAVLSRSLTSISFKFVPRCCNVAADRLAKEALSSLFELPFKGCKLFAMIK